MRQSILTSSRRASADLVPPEAPAAPVFPAHPGADDGDRGAAGEPIENSTTRAAAASTTATVIASRRRLCRARRFASAISRLRENGGLGAAAYTDAIIASTNA